MALKFYCALGDRAQLYASSSNASQITVNTFTAGDLVTIEFGLLAKSPTPAISYWQKQLAAGYSLEIGLFKASDRSQLTYLSTFTNLDEFHKTGVLSLATSEINTALTSVNSVDAVFEIRAGGLTVHSNERVTLLKNYITSGASEPPTTEIAATQNWVKAMCVPRDGTDALNPCSEFFMTSPSGARWKVGVDDNGQMSVTQF